VAGFEDRALRRIQAGMLALGLTGSAVAAAAGGWRWGMAFLLGSVVSWLNFRWLKQTVIALSEAARPGRRPRKRVAVLLGLRYLVLAAGGYAIINYSELSVAAALAGLFVPVAAVLLEILFELIYAGT
jgi:hypothetical protein